MFWESFKIAGSGVLQIFLLGILGYYLVKTEVLGNACLNTLSRLTLEVTLPLMIFSQFVSNFSFHAYPDWWIYPLLSAGVTVVGLAAGIIFSPLVNGQQKRLQFVSLVAFQNSGYLPLALVMALLPQQMVQPMFMQIFLFLLGFNLLMFSVGVYILTFSRQQRFELSSFFNAPVVATLASLAFVFFGGQRFIPEFVLKPAKMAGDCTLPLALLVVGGNLAQIRLGQVDKKAVCALCLAKLVVLPLLGLWLIKSIRLPELVGLLIVMQLAVPSAVTLSALVTHYKKEDVLVSQGIFWTHVVSIVTMPVFLSLYFAFAVIK